MKKFRRSSEHLPYVLPASRVDQQGATLIVVMVLLIVIMLAGVMAVRQSSVDLKLATSDQINTLLLQSSDSANARLEGLVNESPSSTGYQTAMGIVGVYGMHILDEEGKFRETEFVYCYNPRQQSYSIGTATVTKKSGGILYNNNGYCDPSNPDDYTSERQTVLTQVSVVSGAFIGKDVFQHQKEQEDSIRRASKKLNFSIHAMSMIPSYGGSATDLKNCLQRPGFKDFVTDGGQTNYECLRDASVPNKLLYEEAELSNASIPIKCIEFAKGAGSLTCTVPTSASGS